MIVTYREVKKLSDLLMSIFVRLWSGKDVAMQVLLYVGSIIVK